MDKAIKFINSTKGFYSVLENLKIISADKGHCLAEMKVTDRHTNAVGGLHGGCSATIVDVVTTASLKTFIGNKTHVSKGINLTYTKAAVVGQEIIIEAKVTDKSKETVRLTAELKNKTTRETLVKATHLVTLNKDR